MTERLPAGTTMREWEKRERARILGELTDESGHRWYAADNVDMALDLLEERVEEAESELQARKKSCDALIVEIRGVSYYCSKAKGHEQGSGSSADRHANLGLLEEALEGIAYSEQVWTENGEHHRNRLQGWARTVLSPAPESSGVGR